MEELNRRNLRYRIAVDHPAATRAEEQQAAMLPENNDVLAFQEADIIGRNREKAKLTKLISRVEQPEPDQEGEECQIPPLLPRTSTSWWSMSTLLTSWINYTVPYTRIGMVIGPRSQPVPAPPSSLRPDGNGALRVVSVWGMGGMGKSSLVHNDLVLLDEFDVGAWITARQPGSVPAAAEEGPRLSAGPEPGAAPAGQTVPGRRG